MLEDFLRALDALDDTLVERYPKTYGGKYVRNSFSFDMTILVVGEQSGIRNEVLRIMEVATRGLESKPRITFAAAQRTLLALRNLTNRVGFTEIKNWRSRGLHICAVGINTKANAVGLVVVRPDSAVLDDFLESLGVDREMIVVRELAQAPHCMANEHAP